MLVRLIKYLPHIFWHQRHNQCFTMFLEPYPGPSGKHTSSAAGDDHAWILVPPHAVWMSPIGRPYFPYKCVPNSQHTALNVFMLSDIINGCNYYCIILSDIMNGWNYFCMNKLGIYNIYCYVWMFINRNNTYDTLKMILLMEFDVI